MLAVGSFPSSICDRLLANGAEAQEDYLRPVVSGLDVSPPASGRAPNPSASAPELGKRTLAVAGNIPPTRQ